MRRALQTAAAATLLGCSAGAPTPVETPPMGGSSSTGAPPSATTTTGEESTSSSSTSGPVGESSSSSSSSSGEPGPAAGCDNGLVPGDFCFMQVTDYGPFMGASSVASADFDADEVPDLAVAALDEDLIYVLFGDGLGVFVDPIALATGSQPQVVIADDFNLDNDQDLAASNGGGADLSLIFGLDGAAFDPAVPFNVGDFPRPLALADFDGNEFVDIVVGRDDGPTDLRRLMGSRAGFSVAVGPQVDPLSAVLSLAAADLDGDSDADLAVGVEGNEVVVLMGDGTGSFEVTPTSRYPSGGQEPRTVVAADLDGDTLPSLLVGNRGGDANLQILENMGDGTFAAGDSYDVAGVGGIATGDLDGDDNLDVVVTTVAGRTVLAFLGDGAGALGDPIEFDLGAGSEPFGVIVTDLNADGADDIAATDRTGWRLVVFVSHP